MLWNFVFEGSKKHTNIHTYRHAHTHKHKHTQTHKHTKTHKHTNTQRHTYSNTQAHDHTDIQTYRYDAKRPSIVGRGVAGVPRSAIASRPRSGRAYKESDRENDAKADKQRQTYKATGREMLKQANAWKGTGRDN